MRKKTNFRTILMSTALFAICTGVTESAPLEKTNVSSEAPASSSVQHKPAATSSQASDVAVKESGNWTKLMNLIDSCNEFNKPETAEGRQIFKEKYNPKNQLTLKNCGGYCCEGLISVQPVENIQLETYLMLVYAPLQDTLMSHNRDAVRNHFEERVSALRERIQMNLRYVNRSEITFDHLNIRAESEVLPMSKIRQRKYPAAMTIKLWLPDDTDKAIND